MYYSPSPSPFLLDRTHRLVIYLQVYPKNILEAVKKEKDFLEREFFVSLCKKKQPWSDNVAELICFSLCLSREQ